MKRFRQGQRMTALICTAALTLSLAPAVHAAGTPTISKNIYKNDYSTWSRPVTSYLYSNGSGLTRVEYVGNQVVIEDYSSDFTFLNSRTITPELPIWGGFFAGQDYNFLIFGQKNPSESDSVEVIRVVKYDKDWNRLGAASLNGANTTVPFDAGSLRCDEYGGYLYIRTCHEMYASDRDGLNHQANLTLALRESDMTVTDSFYDVMNISYSYVSHSFNQYILVDEDGKIITLDHGDANPRSAVMTGYYSNASTGKFSGSGYSNWCWNMDLITFAGAHGNNTTGASVGGLEETSNGYVMTFNYDGQGGGGERTVYFQYMDKPTGKGKQYKVNNSAGSTTPVLAPTGLEGGYLLWNGKSGSTVDDTLHYIPYTVDGVPGEPQTANAPLSDCQPIPYQDGVVWYVTNNSAPTFYVLNESGVTSYPVGGSSQPEPTPTPTPSNTPTPTPSSTPTPTPSSTPSATPTPTPSPTPSITPTPTPTPGTTTPVDVERMLAAPTISTQAAVKTDGSVWLWGNAAANMGQYNQQSESGIHYQDTPIQALEGCLSAGDYWCVKKDHSLWMWGWTNNITGNFLDEGKITQPVKIMDNVLYFDGSSQCCIVLKTDGTLWGWGDRSILTGDNSNDDIVKSSAPLKLLDNVKQAQSTGWGWMALKEDGSLWSCGISNLSNLNAQDYIFGNQLIPLTHVMDNVAAFDISWQNTVVIKTDGSLWTWGDSSYGQIGNGGDYGKEQGVYHWYPTPYKVMDNVVYASAGYTCYAITSDGTLYGWGRNDNHQLNSTVTNYTSLGETSGYVACQTTPVVVAKDVCAVTETNAYGVWVLKKDGSLWGCGPNSSGCLGMAGTEQVDTLTKLMDGVALPGQGETSTNPQPDPTPNPGTTTSFSDVPANSWYTQDVTAAARAGLMQGTGGNRFSPNATLSVAEVVALTARLYAEDQGERVPTGSGAWYQGAYDYCISKGVFTSQEVPISTMTKAATRFQMVDLLDRAVPDSEKQSTRTLPSGYIPDLKESDPYGAVVYQWYCAGIVDGDGAHRFNGSNQITRAETAAILCRLAGLTPRV